MARPSLRLHLLALGTAVLISAPLLGVMFAAGTGTVPEGRVLLVGAPWRGDHDALEALAAAGARWAVPLGIPGSWLAEFGPDGDRGAARGFFMLPLMDDVEVLLGCAPAGVRPMKAAARS